MTPTRPCPSPAAGDPARLPVSAAVRASRALLILLVSVPLLWLAQRFTAPMTAGVSGSSSEVAVTEAGGGTVRVPSPPNAEPLPLPARLRTSGGRLAWFRSGVDMRGVVSYYQGEMPRYGWRESRLTSDAYTRGLQRSGQAGRVLEFRRAGVTCIVAVYAESDGPGTRVLLLFPPASGTPGAPQGRPKAGR